ncbi:MAG: hypothetical protein ACQESC_03080 [Nanobdellota archaeon]
MEDIISYKESFDISVDGFSGFIFKSTINLKLESDFKTVPFKRLTCDFSLFGSQTEKNVIVPFIVFEGSSSSYPKSVRSFPEIKKAIDGTYAHEVKDFYFEFKKNLSNFLISENQAYANKIKHYDSRAKRWFFPNVINWINARNDLSIYSDLSNSHISYSSARVEVNRFLEDFLPNYSRSVDLLKHSDVISEKESLSMYQIYASINRLYSDFSSELVGLKTPSETLKQKITPFF